jgi:hypothetical protein
METCVFGPVDKRGDVSISLPVISLSSSHSLFPFSFSFSFVCPFVIVDMSASKDKGAMADLEDVDIKVESGVTGQLEAETGAT